MLKYSFFASILKVNEENGRIRIWDPDPNPDPIVRGMDPLIRIHPKISWIRNTAKRFTNTVTDLDEVVNIPYCKGFVFNFGLNFFFAAFFKLFVEN